MRKILSFLLVLVAGISLLCGGTYLFCGQELLSPQTENEVQDEDESVVTEPTASGYWDTTSYHQTTFAGGDGSSDNPYLIATANQLAYAAYQINIGQMRLKSFSLVKDINLSAHYWVPIGNDFSGTFDGDGHIISGITYNQFVSTSLGYECGFFSNVYDATIKNVILMKPSIASSGLSVTSGTVYYGNLVAYAGGGTIISNCSVIDIYTSTGSASNALYLKNIKVTDSPVYIGGLVGYFEPTFTNDTTIMSWCSVKLDFRIGISSAKLTYGCSGGLIGYLKYMDDACMYVENSYFVGRIDSFAYIGGGIIGQTEGNPQITVTQGISTPRIVVRACYYRSLPNTMAQDDCVGCGISGGIVGCALYLTGVKSCLVSANIYGNGAEYCGAIIGGVGSLIKIYSCRWFSRFVGDACGDGTPSVMKNCSAFSSESYAMDSGYYTASSQLYGEGGYEWVFQPTAWMMPSEVTGYRYINGGYPFFGAVPQGVANGFKNVTVSIGNYTTGSFKHYSFGDTATSVNIGTGSTTAVTKTVYQLIGGYLSLTATVDDGITFKGWTIKYSDGTSKTYTSKTISVQMTSTLSGISCYSAKTVYNVYVYYDKNAGAVSYDSASYSHTTSAATYFGRTFSRYLFRYEYGASVRFSFTTDTGYTWGGWKKSYEGEITSTETEMSFQITDSATTIYNYWAWTDEIEYLATLDYSGATSNSPGVFVVGSQWGAWDATSASAGYGSFTYVTPSTDPTATAGYRGYFGVHNSGTANKTYAGVVSLALTTEREVCLTIGTIADSSDGANQTLSFSDIDGEFGTWEYEYVCDTTRDHMQLSFGTLSAGSHKFYVQFTTSSMSISWNAFFKVDDAWVSLYSSSQYQKVIHYKDTFDGLPSNVYKGAAYNFDGWWTSASGAGTQINSNTVFSSVIDTSSLSTTFYARWKDNTADVEIKVITDGASTPSIEGGTYSLEYTDTSGIFHGSSTYYGAYLNDVETYSLKVLLNKAMTFTPKANDGYIFAGVTQSIGIMSEDDTTFTPTEAKTYCLYVHFISRQEQIDLKYDENDKYFYFEDGEYPQSYAWDLNDTLNSVSSSRISYSPDDVVGNGYDLVWKYNIVYSISDGSMKDIDVFVYIDGNKYAMWTATTDVKVNLMYENELKGMYFEKGESYWFKVEPIRWRVSLYGVTNTPQAWSEIGKTKNEFLVVSDKVLTWSVFEPNPTRELFYFSESALCAVTSTPNTKEDSLDLESRIQNVNNGVVARVCTDVLGETSHQDKVYKDKYYNVCGPIAVSLEEIDSCLADRRAYATDFVCALAGIDCTQFCEYWTRDMVTIDNATRITANGKEKTTWMSSCYGVRFSMTMNEGRSLGATTKNYV